MLVLSVHAVNIPTLFVVHVHSHTFFLYMYKEQTTITYVSLSLTVAPFLYSLSLLKIEYLSQNW